MGKVARYYDDEELENMISISCELCGSFNKDERAILEQNEHVLCHHCYGVFDDEELESMIKEEVTLK